MDLVVSGASPDPIYRQVYDQVSRQIVGGFLAGDACLPSIRTVALELRISVITIKKAWDELEKDGFIYTIAGKGCFVSPLAHQTRNDMKIALAADRIAGDVDYCKALGLSLSEVHGLVATRFRN